jgi:hypothetical protein
MGKTNNKIIDKIITNRKNKDKEILKILNNKQQYKIAFVKNGEKKQMEIYSNNNRVLVGDYNFYGIYQPNRNLWIWASLIPGVDKKHMKNIKKMKSFNYLFEEHNDELSNFYYQMLSEDVLMIDDDKLLDDIKSLILYLSDDIYVFNPTNSEGNVQFITLTNIKQKFI